MAAKRLMLSTLLGGTAALDLSSLVPRTFRWFSNGEAAKPAPGLRLVATTTEAPPVAQPAPLPKPRKNGKGLAKDPSTGCCYNDDGTYYANLTILGAASGEAGIGFGVLASDPGSKQALFTISGCHSRCTEGSRVGVWARFCEQENSWFHTAWKNSEEKQYCITYRLPKGYVEPKACVGEGSHFDSFRGPSAMADDDESMLRFASYSSRAQGGMEMYVNSDTCAPYFSMGGSYKYKVFSSAIFQNGTSTIPEGIFTVPSYCSSGAADATTHAARCPTGQVYEPHEAFPGHMKESAETARLFFGGREDY